MYQRELKTETDTAEETSTGGGYTDTNMLETVFLRDNQQSS
jgi:hypothetical protein